MLGKHAVINFHLAARSSFADEETGTQKVTWLTKIPLINGSARKQT